MVGRPPALQKHLLWRVQLCHQKRWNPLFYWVSVVVAAGRFATFSEYFLPPKQRQHKQKAAPKGGFFQKIINARPVQPDT